MPNQHLIWTVLPNGVENNMLRVSVFVTPRLFDGNRLGDFFPGFPEFQNWPAVVKQNGLFNLKVGNVTQQATLTSAPEEQYWTAVFDADTPVIPHEVKDLSQRNILSYPVSEVAQALKREFARVMVESPTEYPVLFRKEGDDDDQRTNLLQFVNQVGRLGVAEERNIVRAQISRQRQFEPLGNVVPNTSLLQIANAIPNDDVTRETVAFAMLDEFYERKKLAAEPETRDPSNILRAPTEPPPQLPDIDFHRVHGILGDYPTLLRVLGFVVDLEVPYTPDMPAEGIVELIAPEDV
ncbi:MAG: hypothetical protein AB8G77_27410, partial [Rhodothermales bacterium]